MTLFSWKSDGGPSLSGAMTALPSDDLYMRNVSALSVDPRTGHTWCCRESHLPLELDEKGEPVSFISLLGGFNGLDSKIARRRGGHRRRGHHLHGQRAEPVLRSARAASAWPPATPIKLRLSAD